MPVHDSKTFTHRLDAPDILIVGCGAVGIAMAVHLARQGQAVAVLEAGPPSPPADYQRANAGPVTGHPHNGITKGRIKTLGGTTRLWGGQLVPFDRSDLESTDAEGRRLWPIDYDEFAVWLDKAYDLLGIPPAARDTGALWERATGAAPDFGNGLSAHMNVWLPEPDFTRLFATELATLPRLDVVTGAEATALDFAPDGRVEAVHVRTATGEERVLRPREVILASGTFEISRLLLRSAATAPNCPFADNRHIGHWYLDHLHGLVGELHDADERQLQRLFDNIYFESRKYNVKLRLDRAAHGRASTANVALTLNPRMTPRALVDETLGLARRMFRGASPWAAVRQGITMTRIMVPLAWRYVVHRRSSGLFGAGTAIGIELEQLPTYDSHLFLDPSEPPETARIGVHWAFDGREMDAMADAAARLKRSFEGLGFGRVDIDPRVVARDPALLFDFTDSAHQMGGARMATSADLGVTDAQCRVFGAPNLSIAGAAVFPSGSFANCTLSAIALALRTADRVAGQVRAHRPEIPVSQPALIDRIVFGCARLTGGASERQSLRLLATAFDAGVRAVDVAPSYGMGTAEIVVGKAVRRAAAREQSIAVLAKLGSARDPKGWIKTWARAAKRLLKPTPPRAMADWTPQVPRVSRAGSAYEPQALRDSFAIARARLGRIDAVLLHEAGPADLGPAQWSTLQAMATSIGAAPGYAVSWPWDASLHAAYRAPMLCETALPPELLQGTMAPPPIAGALFHSIIPTLHFLVRTDPAFAEGLDKAAALSPASDAETRRIAAVYALAGARAPQARLIYASNDAQRLGAFLEAVRTIDSHHLAGPIAACFA